MEYGYIYKVTNSCNDKVYIGQTYMTINKRWRSHVYSANRGVKTKFYQAMRKYGIINFKIDVIEKYEADTVVQLKEILNEREIFYINKFDSFKNGYNSTIGGDPTIKELSENKQYIKNPYKWDRNDNRKNEQQMKGIKMYDLYGHFLEKYESIQSCCDKNNLTPSKVSSVCKDLVTQHNGYYFRYDLDNDYKDINIDIDYGKIAGRKYFHVSQYNEQNELIKIWDNLNEIASFLCLSSTNKIIKSMNDKTLYKGYYWDFNLPNNNCKSVYGID